MPSFFPLFLTYNSLMSQPRHNSLRKCTIFFSSLPADKLFFFFFSFGDLGGRSNGNYDLTTLNLPLRPLPPLLASTDWLLSYCSPQYWLLHRSIYSVAVAAGVRFVDNGDNISKSDAQDGITTDIDSS